MPLTGLAGAVAALSRASGTEPQLVLQVLSAREPSRLRPTRLARLRRLEVGRAANAGRTVGRPHADPEAGLPASHAGPRVLARQADRVRLEARQPSEVPAPRAHSPLEQPLVAGLTEPRAPVDACDLHTVTATLVAPAGVLLCLAGHCPVRSTLRSRRFIIARTSCRGRGPLGRFRGGWRRPGLVSSGSVGTPGPSASGRLRRPPSSPCRLTPEAVSASRNALRCSRIMHHTASSSACLSSTPSSSILAPGAARSRSASSIPAAASTCLSPFVGLRTVCRTRLQRKSATANHSAASTLSSKHRPPPAFITPSPACWNASASG